MTLFHKNFQRDILKLCPFNIFQIQQIPNYNKFILLNSDSSIQKLLAEFITAWKQLLNLPMNSRQSLWIVFCSGRSKIPSHDAKLSPFPATFRAIWKKKKKKQLAPYVISHSWKICYNNIRGLDLGIIMYTSKITSKMSISNFTIWFTNLLFYYLLFYYFMLNQWIKWITQSIYIIFYTCKLISSKHH